MIKHRLKFKDYYGSLFKNKNILRTQQRFRSDHHNVYTEEVNKIVLSSSDDKRLQTHNKSHTHTELTHLKYVKAKCYY